MKNGFSSCVEMCSIPFSWVRFVCLRDMLVCLGIVGDAACVCRMVVVAVSDMLIHILLMDRQLR